MPLLSHSLPSVHGTAPPPTRSTTGARRSLLDRLDHPRAVFALLGTAALIGLMLAFGVLRGLQHFGRTGEPATSPDTLATSRGEATAKHRPPPPNLTAELQYEVMNGTGSASAPTTPVAPASSVPGRDAAAPNVPSVAPAPGSATANASSSQSMQSAAEVPTATPLVLNARQIAPVSRTTPLMVILPSPPRFSAAQLRASAPPLPEAANATASARPVESNALPPGERSRTELARAEAPPPDDRTAARSVAPSAPIAPSVVPVAASPANARALNNQANHAFWIKHDVREALELQRRAFEINPGDVEIAGNLAFYYLKQTPPRPDAARQMASHALSASSTSERAGRLEDWVSYAIASALLGRTRDAENGFLAAATMGNLDRTCRAALNAVATFGDQVRAPAITLLRQIDAQGRSNASPYCAWPPNWSLGRRVPS